MITRRRWTRGTGTLVLLACCTTAATADIRVLSAAAVKGPISEIAAEFELATGQRVTFDFATAGGVDAKLAAGAHPDVVINGSARIVARAQATAGGGVVRDLGTVRMGVAVRPGAVRPDVSSVETFRAALLSASSIAYGDPARGATTGVHFAKLLDRLGIADAVAAKSRLAADGLDVMRKVTRGEAEIGITQKSEILHADPAAFGGLLPEELQLATTYTAWVRDSGNLAARAFVDMLGGPGGRQRFRAEGFD
jgi:molybdate transport system substrate-binding protein